MNINVDTTTNTTMDTIVDTTTNTTMDTTVDTNTATNMNVNPDNDVSEELYDKYDISSNGFAPERCVNRFPVGFEMYQALKTILPTENADKFREIVDKIGEEFIEETIDYNSSESSSDSDYRSSIPSTRNLSANEKKYLYSILSMVVHKYVWCKGESGVIDTIPQYIGKPWLEVCDDLGLPPVLTHAAVDLYNWSKRNDFKDISLDNLQSNNMMLNNPSEQWFYLVMVAIECESADAIKSVYKIWKELEKTNSEPNVEFVTKHLQIIHTTLVSICGIIARMYEGCEPDFFFKELRIYLKGSNSKDSDEKPLFPDGIKIKNMRHNKISYSGGSAAQSSLIQMFDVFFGIEHSGNRKEFLDDMRNYMPKQHKQFLSDLQSCTFSTFVKNNGNEELVHLTNRCVDTLTRFRGNHFGLVKKYISKYDETKGTGGTIPEKFLMEIMKDTTKTAKDVLSSYAQYLQKEKFVKNTQSILYTGAIASIPIAVGYIWYSYWHCLPYFKDC